MNSGHLLPSDGARTQQLPVQDGSVSPKPKKKRDKVKVAFFIVLSIILAFLLAGGIYAWTLWNAFNQRDVLDDAFPDGDRPAAVEGAQTILLLGSDSRKGISDGKIGRADTIMVVHVPADHGTVQVMSIMRDNWVEVPGHGDNKINAASAFGGIPLMVKTVEGLIETRIDHVAIIDFESFKGLTSAVGGVTVNNPKAFTAVSGERFEKGEITLEGSDALAFVRERKAFATGDYQRAANQQLLVKGLVSKVLSADTLTNPARISALVNEASSFLTTDAGMDAGYMLGLAVSMKDIRSNDVRFFTSPTLGTGMVGGQSIVKPDFDALAEISRRIKDGTLDEYQPTGK